MDTALPILSGAHSNKNCAERRRPHLARANEAPLGEAAYSDLDYASSDFEKARLRIAHPMPADRRPLRSERFGAVPLLKLADQRRFDFLPR